MARPSNKGLISCFFALIRELTGVAILSLTLTFFIGPVHTFAQVATIITESGLDTSIEHTAGSTTWNIRGGRPSSGNTNLFHSFGDLSVGTGDTAVFQNLQADGTTPVVTNAGGVNNIIGRVTGGNPSNIFGTINSQTGFPNANLFLINPAGVVFGSGATLNVGGSVYFSTADYLRLGTGNEFFFADLTKSSTLSSAPVTAFGFLGDTPGAVQAIEVQGTLSVNGADSLSLVGRDIGAGSTAVQGITIDGGRISNPGGRINLVSVGTPLDTTAGGEVSAIDLNPAPTSSGQGFASLGNIVMTDGDLTVTNASGPAAGEIVIRGGQLTMEGGSRLLAITTDANTVPGGIDINVTGAMTLSGGQTAIDTENTGSATIPGSDILIRAGSLSVTEGAQIRATNNSSDPAVPSGGTIDITADTVTLSGAIDGGGSTVSSGLFSGISRTTTGAGGHIRVTTNQLSIMDGAKIDSSTQGLGNAGDIDITARSILLSGVNTTNGVSSPPSAVSSTSTIDPQTDNPNSDQLNRGDAGNIQIQTSSLHILDGAQLNARTETAGNAGTIDVTADTISIAGGQGVQRSGITTETTLGGSAGGTGGNVALTVASLLDLSDEGEIALDTSGDGSAGTLNVHAGTINLTSGAQVTSGTISSGAAGNLSLTAGSLVVQDSVISTRTFGSGSAGNIAISAGNVTVNGLTSQIDSSTNSSTTSAGAGGSISVTASNTLAVQGGTITTSSFGSGNAGTVQVTADHVQLSGGGEISSSTAGSGEGGTVSVVGAGPTGTVQLSGGSITAATTDSGHAGNISVSGTTVNVSGAASSIDSSTISTGNAGNIQVQAGQVNLGTGGTISSASIASATGNAGFVTIITTDQFQSDGGKVTTSADNGQGGDITIQSDEILLNSGAAIAANTAGLLDAGNIRLVADDRIILQDSTVTTTALQASGGNITLLAPNLVRLINGQIISSVQGGSATTGGDITIDPQAVLLQNNSQILAQAFLGNGGNISITAGVLIVEPGSLIDATSQLGINGQVSVQAPIQNLAGLVTPLPQSFVNVGTLYGQHCAASEAGQFSSLVQGARDGVPPQPGDFLSSPLGDDSMMAPPSLSQPSADLHWSAIRLGLTDGPIHEKTALASGCRS